MSEPWKANAKHWCKYCSQFVYDNKISRQNHDNGWKHKNAVKAYLRDINHKQLKKSREDEQTKRLLQDIERAAVATYSAEVGQSEEAVIAEDRKYSHLSSSQGGASSSVKRKEAGSSSYSLIGAEEERRKQQGSGANSSTLKSAINANDARPGEWVVSETAMKRRTETDDHETKKPSSLSHAVAVREDQDDDEEDPVEREKAKNFQFREKAVVMDDADGGGGGMVNDDQSTLGGSMFIKKRKIGTAKNIRKKI